MALVWYQRICKGFKLYSELPQNILFCSPAAYKTPEEERSHFYTGVLALERTIYSYLFWNDPETLTTHRQSLETWFFFPPRTARPIVWSGIQCTAQREKEKKILRARFGIAQRESWQNITECFLEVHGESRQCVPEKRLLFISTTLPPQDCDRLCMSFFWSHKENAIHIYVFALHTTNAIQWNMRPVSPHNA